MADRTISQLTPATEVTPSDLFVLEQSNTAKSLTGQILEDWLLDLADGHGGISSIDKTSTSGLVDTYTITFADASTYNFTVTNGKQISSIATYYAVSESGTTPPTTFSLARQNMTPEKRYLWCFDRITYNDGSASVTTQRVIGVYGDKGETGDDGRGIESLSETSRVPQEYTVYTFEMTDGTTESFISYDGISITSIDKTNTSGLVDTYTITFSDGSTSLFTVTNARSITSVTLTSTVGLVNTYTISFNDGTSTTFTVTNGASIQSIDKTSSTGLVDIYTVTLTNGDTDTFSVTNAKSIVSVTRVSGDGSPGSVDTYRIAYNDGDSTDFEVYNGTNGTGSVASVDGIQAVNQNVQLLITGNGAPTTSTVGSLYQRYFDLNSHILYICTAITDGGSSTTYTWLGTGVPVDSALSTTSQNPVQNRVITSKVGTLTLTTTAQDLSSAVNELDNDIAALPATATPLMDGTAAVGSSAKLARQDHVHPHDSSIAHRNLLDNWYFVGGGSQIGSGVFPINQRGQTSYSLSNGETCIDRWKMTRSSTSASDPLNVVLNSSGLSISKTTTGAGRFIQQAEKYWDAGTYTISVLVNSVTVPEGATDPYIGLLDPNNYIVTGSRTNITGSGFFTSTFFLPNVVERYKYSKTFVLMIPEGVSIDVTAVKLELGSYQTLAHQENGAWVLNELPDWGEELRKCQRYLQWVASPWPSNFAPVGSGMCWGTTAARIALPLPVPMVGTPTVTLQNSNARIYLSDGSEAITPTTITAQTSSYNNANMRSILCLVCAIEGGINRAQVVLTISGTANPGGILLSCEP